MWEWKTCQMTCLKCLFNLQYEWYSSGDMTNFRPTRTSLLWDFYGLAIWEWRKKWPRTKILNCLWLKKFSGVSASLAPRCLLMGITIKLSMERRYDCQLSATALDATVWSLCQSSWVHTRYVLVSLLPSMNLAKLIMSNSFIRNTIAPRLPRCSVVLKTLISAVLTSSFVLTLSAPTFSSQVSRRRNADYRWRASRFLGCSLACIISMLIETR